MSNKNLFQEAIADAKAVREAALANAKAALEEALTPRLQSMIAMQLEENYDNLEEELDEYAEMQPENEEDAKRTQEEGMYPDDTTDEIQDRYRATGAALEEENLDLSEILAELEAESQLEEAKKEDEETEDEEDEEAEEDETPDEEEAEPTKVKDMTDEELIDLIKDIVKQEIESEEEQPSDEAGEEEQGEMNMEPMGNEPAPVTDEEIDINELLAELDEMYGNEEKEESMQYEAKKTKKDVKKDDEIKEALSVINTLRSELNEVNLLNAKLLYVNKIFKAKSLSESQKVQVIASFDKATTIKEAKVVYESLTTALTAPKKPLKESLGFASRAAGIAPRKQQIVESNDAITRMQKLANIIK
jgi:hypothetical protein